MGENERWTVGIPGGPSGPFYSICDNNGRIIAMQIPDEKTAYRLAELPKMQERIAELEAALELALKNLSAICIWLDNHSASTGEFENPAIIWYDDWKLAWDNIEGVLEKLDPDDKISHEWKMHDG